MESRGGGRQELLNVEEGGSVERQIRGQRRRLHVCVRGTGQGEEETLTLCIIRQVDWEHQAEL